MLPHWPARGEAISFEQRFLRESDGFGYRCQRDAPTPAPVADKVPGPAFGHVLQDLPDHDARTFKSGFAVADFRVGHDVFAQFNALRWVFAVFHYLTIITEPHQNNKPYNFAMSRMTWIFFRNERGLFR
jgi:hypothetical protein